MIRNTLDANPPSLPHNMLRRVSQKLARASGVAPARRVVSQSPSYSTDGGDDRRMRPMPEPTFSHVEESQPIADDKELEQRRAQALRKWLESELGEERTTLMSILAKHRVQVPGGTEDATNLMDELLLWKEGGAGK